MFLLFLNKKLYDCVYLIGRLDLKIIDKFIKWSLSKLNQWYQYRIEKYGTKIPNNPDNYEVLIGMTPIT